MKTIRWGIIGCGDVTEVKSGPGFQKARGSELVAVMRRSGDKAADYARRHGVAKWTTDAHALIHDPAVDAVYIATPPDSHAEYTLAVAAAGKPVYVEKPMARTVAECQQMVDACARHGVPLFVAYYRRTLPTFLKVKELVDSGAIGAVRAVNIRLFRAPHAGDAAAEKPWRVQPEIAGGGYFYDLASHQFDFLDYLLGPVAAAQGYTANHAGLYDAEDTVAATFRFDSGVLGTGTWCFTADSGKAWDETEIIGSKGIIRYASFDLNAPVQLEQGGSVETFHLPPPAHVQQPLIETIVAALRGEGDCPSTGESALRTNWVLEQIAHRA